jgi:hypothetical protein
MAAMIVLIERTGAQRRIAWKPAESLNFFDLSYNPILSPITTCSLWSA